MNPLYIFSMLVLFKQQPQNGILNSVGGVSIKPNNYCDDSIVLQLRIIELFMDFVYH